MSQTTTLGGTDHRDESSRRGRVLELEAAPRLGRQRVCNRLPGQPSVILVVSNAPGPPSALHRAGASVLKLFPTMPTMGDLTLVVAALSNAGQLTAVADTQSRPDVEVFTEGIRTALGDLTRTLARPAP